MPFTLSHAVLAPPLSKLTQGRLPIAALAIGCMTPDLIRLFTQHDGGKTQLWQALIYPNLFIGLGFCLIWYALYRPTLFRFFGLQDQLPIHNLRNVLGFVLGTILAILLGICTHLIWDGFTHVDSRTIAFRQILSQSIILFGYSYPLHRILQIGCSIVTLPILYWMCHRYYLNTRQSTPIESKIKRYACVLCLITVLISSCSALDYARYFTQELWMSNLYYFTGLTINVFSQVALIIFTLGCVLFLFLDHQRYFK